MNTNTPEWSIVAGVRAAQAAFPPSTDDTPYDRAKRATAAIAEAGLRLRESLPPGDRLGALANLCDRLDAARGAIDETEIQDDARHVAASIDAFDAAVRAAVDGALP